MYKILWIFLLVCSTYSWGQDTEPLRIDNGKKKDLLDKIYKAIADNYVFPDTGSIMIKYLKQQAASQKYDLIANPHDFAAAVTRDMKTQYNDRHIRITYDPKLQQDIVAFLSSKKGAQRINNEDSLQDAKQNFYFRKVEILPSNIGYIEFTSFARQNAAASRTIRAAMQFVSHADAVIIDLRNNFGGDAAMANEILSYFFKSKTLTGKSFNRIENRWTNEFVENKKAITGGLVLSVPVYILTSSRTYSSAEGFAYAMQNLRNAIVIGDTTRGGAHLTRSFSLGDGFVAFIPYQRSANAKTKTNWEAVGVIPQVPVEESKALRLAQKMALSDKLSKASEEKEKRKITWILNYYQSQDSPVSILAADYTEAVGRYAEFEISIVDNQLYFRDTHQRTKDYKQLIAIHPSLFQVERDYQVELVKDGEGKFNGIRMFWDDGWTEFIQRSN